MGNVTDNGTIPSPFPASQFVFGGHCQQEAKLDRPIAAYLSFCPAFLLTNSDLYHLQITTVVQKMVQILVSQHYHLCRTLAKSCSCCEHCFSCGSPT